MNNNIDYKDQVLEDLKTWAEEGNAEGVETAEELREVLRDPSMTDGITGNASGSYYCNAYKAREQVDASGILWDEDFADWLADVGQGWRVWEVGEADQEQRLQNMGNSTARSNIHIVIEVPSLRQLSSTAISACQKYHTMNWNSWRMKMKRNEVEYWVKYEVYEKIDDQPHILALCTEYEVAGIIAATLAKSDPKGDSYYVTCIDTPNALVSGGGWHDKYYMEDGELKDSHLM